MSNSKTIWVLTNSGNWVSVHPAVVIGRVAVHEELQDLKDIFSRPRWIVSHLPSGGRICDVASEDRALTIAEAIGHLDCLNFALRDLANAGDQAKFLRPIGRALRRAIKDATRMTISFRRKALPDMAREDLLRAARARAEMAQVVPVLVRPALPGAMCLSAPAPPLGPPR